MTSLQRWLALYDLNGGGIYFDNLMIIDQEHNGNLTFVLEHANDTLQ